MVRTSSTSDSSVVVTLLSLCGMLCLYLAELLSAPVFILLTLVHVIIWRWMYFRSPLPKSLFIIAVFGVFSLEIGRIILQGRVGIIPALRDMIVILALTRLILPKTGREIYQIVVIAFSQCIFATILTTSPLFLIGLGLMVCLIPIVLAHLDENDFEGVDHISRQNPLHWVLVWSSIIAVTCLLFYLIPRPSSSLIKASLVQQSTVGFSEEVNLSRSSDLVENDRIVMRLVWNSGSVPDAIYLSGARLDDLSGQGFSPYHGESAPKGTAFGYIRTYTDHITIYPTGLDARNVFFPYGLVSISPDSVSRRGSNVYWRKDPPPVYDVWVTRTLTSAWNQPVTIPEELKEVALFGERIAGQGTTKARVERIARFLRGTYEYSLKGVSIPEGISPISWFVFRGKRGSCEHFASSLATMIRGCGIPARVVTGFLVNEYNPSGNYFVVRARTAHAWVEYWDGSWHTIDATPQAQAGLLNRPSLLDSLRFSWIRWVIHYSLDDQLKIAEYLVISSQGMRTRLDIVAYAGLAGVFVILGALLMRALFRLKRLGPYQKVMRAFSDRGVTLDATMPHEDHLLEIIEQWPEMEDAFRVYVQDYLFWRFGNSDIDISSRTQELIERIHSLSGR
ncbi:MAG: transglutaminaseTgpA domain-containing protein [Desulfomonilia bacterium]